MLTVKIISYIFYLTCVKCVDVCVDLEIILKQHCRQIVISLTLHVCDRRCKLVSLTSLAVN